MDPSVRPRLRGWLDRSETVALDPPRIEALARALDDADPPVRVERWGSVARRGRRVDGSFSSIATATSSLPAAGPLTGRSRGRAAGPPMGDGSASNPERATTAYGDARIACGSWMARSPGGRWRC